MSTGSVYLGVFGGAFSDSGVENAQKSNTLLRVDLTSYEGELFEEPKFDVDSIKKTKSGFLIWIYQAAT